MSDSDEETAHQEALSEQVARDMQLAWDLQQREHEMRSQLDRGTNDVAANTNILGGGITGGDAATVQSTEQASRKTAKAFARVSQMISNSVNRQDNSLLDDGSSSMQSNGSLLYVPCEINGRMVEMMVDSGSQTSVISSSMMRRLHLDKRLNTRYQGVAAGVGAAKILGRIDQCAVMLGSGHVEFNLFFLVIDVAHDMMILGIDQMRRFNCLIDLQNNVLVFGGVGGVPVPFMPPDGNHVDAREQCTVSTMQSKKDKKKWW